MDDEAPLNTHELTVWLSELQSGRPATAEPVFRKILDGVERRERPLFARSPRAGRFVDRACQSSPHGKSRQLIGLVWRSWWRCEVVVNLVRSADRLVGREVQSLGFAEPSHARAAK